LFMIDVEEESDQPGTTFFSSKAAENQPSLTINGDNTCQTAAEIACGLKEFSMLCEFSKTAGLFDVLNSNTAFDEKTVFAPTNDAFGNLAKETLDTLVGDTLTAALQYHVVGKKIMSKDLKCAGSTVMAQGGTSTTLCGSNDGAVYQVGSGVSPGVDSLPKVVTADIPTCYGVIHTVDQVLIPAAADPTCIDGGEQSIADICGKPEFADFCGLVNQTGIETILSSGLYTIFAPTNAALQNATARLSGTVDFSDPKIVIDIVLQHIVQGSAIFAKDVVCNNEVEMANGAKNGFLCYSGDVINIAGPFYDPLSDPLLSITKTDIVGCNVIIHRIDGVILPKLKSAPISSGDESSSDDGSSSGNGTSSDDEASYDPCGICGPGSSVTSADTLIVIPESVGLPAIDGETTCEKVDSLCMSGGCSPDTCVSFDEDTMSVCGCEESSSYTVVDVLLADTDTYSTLVQAVTDAGLEETLRTSEGITLFAPNNVAFVDLEEEKPGLFGFLMSGPNFVHLENLLSYHVLPIELSSTKIFDDLTVGDGSDFVSLTEEVIRVRINKNDKIFADEKRVLPPDSEADNGVVHNVEGVLLPPWAEKTVLDVIGEIPEAVVVNTMMTQDLSLPEILNGPGPFTVFAPVDSALEAQMASLQEMMGDDPSTIPSMLNYHIVEGIYPASAISDGLELPTVQGGTLLFEVEGESVKVNEQLVISTDFLASNGIVHLIDGVLLPDSLTGIGV